MGLRLNDGSGNHVELSAPSLTGNVNLTLPNSIGAAGQFLQVGANGVTTWATAINLIYFLKPLAMHKLIQHVHVLILVLLKVLHHIPLHINGNLQQAVALLLMM